jgi:hypothetical protein
VHDTGSQIRPLGTQVIIYLQVNFLHFSEEGLVFKTKNKLSLGNGGKLHNGFKMSSESIILSLQFGKRVVKIAVLFGPEIFPIIQTTLNPPLYPAKHLNLFSQPEILTFKVLQFAKNHQAAI